MLFKTHIMRLEYSIFLIFLFYLFILIFFIFHLSKCY